MNRPNLRTITTSLVALALPVAILASAATAAYYKNTNPDNVDITQGLAYLQQSMMAGVIAFALFVALSVVGIVMMYRSERNFINAKLPLVLLVTVLVLVAGIVMLNAYTNQVQDQYLIDNGRPTMKQFFDQLEKQESN